MLKQGWSEKQTIKDRMDKVGTKKTEQQCIWKRERPQIYKINQTPKNEGWWHLSMPISVYLS